MIDGRALAAEERRVLGDRVASLAEQGRQVRLDAILTEGDAGAEIYAQRQRAGCRVAAAWAALGRKHGTRSATQSTSRTRSIMIPEELKAC